MLPAAFQLHKPVAGCEIPDTSACSAPWEFIFFLKKLYWQLNITKNHLAQLRAFFQKT